MSSGISTPDVGNWFRRFEGAIAFLVKEGSISDQSMIRSGMEISLKRKAMAPLKRRDKLPTSGVDIPEDIFGDSLMFYSVKEFCYSFIQLFNMFHHFFYA